VKATALTVAVLLGVATGLVAIATDRLGLPGFLMTAAPLGVGLVILSRRLRRRTKGPRT
jgi:hypothetical protein